MENSQEFNLCIFVTKKDNTYKLKVHTFSNGSPEDILEWEKKMMKIIKCKPVDTAEVAHMSKNSDGSDTAPLGMCDPTFTICFQELKKHYFPKNASRFQKSYLPNYIKKPNKLTIKNTAARLHNVNGMMARFPAPGNNPMADDELCNILYQM
eukprot:13798840-Ditylum_brightwellii.AAC.1